MPDLLLGVVLVLAGLGSAAATGALFWAWRRRNEIIKAFMRYALPAPSPAPPAPTGSTLPPAPLNETAETSRAGERARLIHGFDPATLQWLCDSLAGGMPWTEATLENMRVPHMFPPARFGKSEKGTVYWRLFDAKIPAGLYVRAGIIIERGGPGNSPGKLAIQSPLNMMQAIKELPETDTNQLPT